MKKILFFYLLLTLLMAIIFSLPNQSQIPPAEYIVSESEIEQHKLELANQYPHLTQDQIDQSAEIYIKQMQSYHKIKNSDTSLDFWSALKLSFKYSTIIFVIVFLCYLFKVSYFNHLFGESETGKWETYLDFSLVKCVNILTYFTFLSRLTHYIFFHFIYYFLF